MTPNHSTDANDAPKRGHQYDPQGYYFAYGTWLDPRLLAVRAPGVTPVALAIARNHRVEFRQSAGGEDDKGWLHLADSGDAWGSDAYGVVVPIGSPSEAKVFSANETRYLTVHGTDGVAYDCWTYVLASPGDAVRVPIYEWEHITAGITFWKLSDSYVGTLQHTYDTAAACPRPDRANPVDLGPTQALGMR